MVSEQIAEEHHVGVGGTLTLPTPSGDAASGSPRLTTNLAWTPGVIFIGTADYSRLWATPAPTALGVDLRPGANPPARARRDRARRSGTRERPGSRHRGHTRSEHRRA